MNFSSLTPEEKKIRATQLLIENKRKKAREDLIEFSNYIDPTARKWYKAKHLRKIADLLMKAESGELRREGKIGIILSVPPRFWKSSLVSEKFPAWYLGRHPQNSVIVSSYAASLAMKFSRTVRDTVRDNSKFFDLFPLELKKDSEAVEDWSLETAYRSSMRAAGVLGGITGHGAQCLIIDDPVENDKQARSQVYRENAWNWYRQTFRTRLEPDGFIVVVATRWHESDISGRLIEEMNHGGEQYEVVNLPALDEENHSLWEERFSTEQMLSIQIAVGEYAWNCLYMGKPIKEEGTLIRRDDFDFIPALPEGAEWDVCYWDLAITEKVTQKDDPDFTARCYAVLHNSILYLGKPLLFRKEFPDVVAEIMTEKMNDMRVRHGTAKSMAETSAVQSLLMKGFYLEQVKEDTDKLTRALPFINQGRIGHVVLVGTEEEWEPFLSQWVRFPNGAHDDAVDCASGITKMLGLSFDPEPQDEESFDDPYAFIEGKTGNSDSYVGEAPRL